MQMIGQGSYALVLKAKWKSETVAIKMFPRHVLETNDFQQELQLMMLLKHPNIVTMLGACIKVPRIGIVMEFCANGSLAIYIRQNKGKIGFSRKLRILLDVARGMRFLHSNNVIHRDLKCENVLLDNNMVAKVADFGLSRKSAHGVKMTTMVGSPAYMAPELVANEFYDEKIDVFSFAIVMFELYTESLEPYGPAPFGVELKVSKNPLFRPVFPDNFLVRTDEMFIVSLMQECWRHNPKERPSFDDIVQKFEGNLV
jgi:serine/threonine protein kinase